MTRHLSHVGTDDEARMVNVSAKPLIQRLARAVNPRLIITGHENEMGHTVDHREDYTQTYNHLFGTPYPFIVMAWGESYLFRK